MIKQTFIKSTTFLFILIVSFIITGSVFGQQASPKHNSDNKADKNLKSLARVNPSTLAMEMTLPMLNYPGRGGNSLPVGITYSSKVWRMNQAGSYWYQLPSSCTRQYVQQLKPIFGERSVAGWNSSIAFPVIEEKFESYDEEGKPYVMSLSEPAFNNSFTEYMQNLPEENLQEPDDPTSCGWNCTYGQSPVTGAWHCLQTYYSSEGCPIIVGSGGGGGCPTGGENPIQPPRYFVNRLRVRMAAGSTVEFRKSDSIFEGNQFDHFGVFLSVDGSGMRLHRTETGSTLYLPNGDRFLFSSTSDSIHEGARLYKATELIDVNGNKTTFSDAVVGNNRIRKITDTLGREIKDPLPFNFRTQSQSEGVREINLPGMDGNPPQKYEMKWLHLKPVAGGIQEGALEDQSQNTFYYTSNICFGNYYGTPLPNGEVMFPSNGLGLRTCNPFTGTTAQTAVPARFNPVVLAEVLLPNDQKYEFKYNQYGEITKIIYPAGSYETFVYDRIAPMSGFAGDAFDQANRGVKERRVHRADGTLEQQWKYEAGYTGAVWQSGSKYKVTTTAPKGDNPTGVGAKIERYLHRSTSEDTGFGFENPTDGYVYEERSFDENGVLRSRSLSDYTIKSNLTGTASNPGMAFALRDSRIKRTVSTVIENGQALATLSENEYETPGENNSTAPTDPEYFAHLNVKRSKGYHYAVIPLNLAQTGTLAQIASYFNGALLASVSETDYQYSAAYEDRGIASLPIESRVLNAQNTTEVLAKTQTVYDEYDFATSGDLSGNLINTWINPLTDPTIDPTIPASTRALRGKPTTAKIWDSDNNAWIQTHSQYDKYGNARKVWEPNENINSSNRFVETEYGSQYGFAYPTSVTTPAPGDGTYGTDQGSTASTTYDFTTGLTLTATNDLGQTTATEYNDAMLRPTRSYAVNFSAPEAQTVYDDNQRWVKVRKQIDANNWDEATTFADSLGRTIKTQSKDSQGDVFVETEYDFLGRVKRTSNPYRQGETKYWSQPRYDVMGRAVEAFAPAIDGQTGASLGVTSYSISTVPNFVGTVVTTADASGRKGRSITNALGQLLRVDEPQNIGGTADADLGTLASPLQPTFYKYNAQGKMVEVEQGAQKRFFKYDSLGRLIRVRQPEQDANPSLNLADNYNTSGQWTAKFTYDVLGNVLTATDAKGTQINYTYDKASRVKTRSYANEPNGVTTPSVSYFYDGKGLDAQQSPNYAKGKLTKVTSSVSESRYTKFDYLGRLLESEQRTPFGTETIAQAEARVSKYEYNFSGALIKQTYPSGRVVENAFEADGDLSRVFGQANANAIERTYANSFSYTPDGRIEKLRLGNHRWEWAKFNERLQVTELNLGSGATDASLWKLKYEYGEIDANGNVNAAKNTGNIARQTTSFNGLANPFVQSFKYDSLYRLTEARETSNSQQTWKQSFTYDRYGNRIGYENFVGTTQQTLDNKTHPTINPQTNRFNTNQGYSYDFNGNLISDAENRQFTFNGDNKQTEIRNGTTLLARYSYDGEGKRIKKIVYNANGVTIKEETVFVYDGLGKLVAEYSTKEPPTNPTTSYTVTDQLGSPRVITNSKGEVVSRRDFQPFGEELFPDMTYRTSALKYGSSDGIRQKFTSYQRDEETLLDFAEARMYENRHARFTAVDPLLASGKSANPQTFNRYVYVINNPLIFTDPTGLQIATDPEINDDEVVATITTRMYEWFNRTFSYGGNSVTIREPRVPTEVYNNTEAENFLNRKQGRGILRVTTPTLGLPASSFAPYGTPEEVANVENAINTIDVTGTFNMMNNSYKYRTGQASGTELGGSILMFGTNFIPGGGGGGAKQKIGREIALGLETLAENGNTRFVLRELADTTGGTMAKFWADEGITRRTINNRFGRAFNQATERADTIHFALDGLINDIPGALDKGRRFGFDVGRRNVTNAELYTIYSNPSLLNKTQFYLNNRLVQPPANPNYVFR